MSEQYLHEQRELIVCNAVNTAEELQRRDRLLKRLDDIDTNAYNEFNLLLEQLNTIDVRYRIFGFKHCGAVFDYMRELFNDYLTVKKRLNVNERKVLALVKANANRLMSGLEQQESLLTAYLTKYHAAEAMHNLRLCYVDTATFMLYAIQSDMLWLQSHQ